MGTKQPQKHKNNIKDTSNDTQKKKDTKQPQKFRNDAP